MTPTRVPATSPPTLFNCKFSGLDPVLIKLLQAELPAILEGVVEEVCGTIPEVALILKNPGTAGRLHSSDRIQYYLQKFSDPLISRSERVGACENIGRDAYWDGVSLDTLQAIFRITTQAAWRRLAHLGLVAEVSADQFFQFTEGLFAEVDEACALALAAYSELSTSDADAVRGKRRRLLNALLTEADTTEADTINWLARDAQWRLPATVACVAVDGQWHTQHRMPPALGPDVLMDLERPDPVLLVPDPDGPGRLDIMRRAFRGMRFSIGISVPPLAAATSLRIARHALGLIHRGILPDGQYIHCSEHLPLLLLLNDVDVARHLVRRQLSALDDLRAEQRERLTETLLAWLTTGGSSPEVAARLCVHPQTVRYRMRRLERLFGERLHEPAWRLETLLALHIERLTQA